jgi:hypothetical protein
VVNTNAENGRSLRPAERALILALSPQFGVELDDALVREMQDGGMGSIRFLGGDDRRYGRTIAEAMYVDDDGIVVSIHLNVDKTDSLFELDLWKVDFSPLLRYPRPDDLQR